MLLEHKTAIVYGGGGAIGSTVARSFAREGARVFLAGRSRDRLQAVADDIETEGGMAGVAEVDALDERAVEDHTRAVARRGGAIDILFNAIGMDDVQGAELTEMPVEDFMRPVVKALRTQFLTARAAARCMADRRSGVILTITAGPPEPLPLIGGFGPACGAVEGLWRGLAAELGPRGVRVVCLRSGGSPDTPDLQHTFRQHARATGTTYEKVLAQFGAATLLGRLPAVAEVAHVATFLASDRASAVTGAFVSVTCGSRGD